MLKMTKSKIFLPTLNKKFKNLKNKKIGKRNKCKESIRESKNVKEREINNKNKIMMIR